MKTRIPVLALCGLLAHAANAQFHTDDVKYWVGTGTDTSVLVVDFQDGSWDPSYAWGYLHNGTTAQQMLADIAAADVNFDVAIGGGFLSDITYGIHAGIGGNPDYWSTWSGTDIATMNTNGGISEPLSNGEWFGCSYTDFNPALAPTGPLAAFEPFRFTAEDVTYWVGAGSDTAVLVVDFQDGTDPSAYAWGYLFDGTPTGETMLNDIAAADPLLEVVMVGGFLNDILYGGHEGLVGDPNYWSTWTATNLGNWNMNMGVGTTVNNGDLFGCSYTDFSPAIRPGYPVAASGISAVAQNVGHVLEVYPQPAAEMFFVNGGDPVATLRVFDLSGRSMHEDGVRHGVRSIDVSAWPAGSYVLDIGGARRIIAVR